MLAGRKVMTPGCRYKVNSNGAVPVVSDWSVGANIIHEVPQGAIVVCAEVRFDDSGIQWVRISSPAGWMDAEALEPVSVIKPHRPDFEFFREHHLDVAPGDFDGLEFPFTFEMLRAFGPEFLTAAFRTSGYIGSDNSVTEIVEIAPLGLKGASENAFLTVVYAKPDPAVQTRLFVKFPPVPVDYKYFQSAMAIGEVQMMRFSQRGILPVRVARCCFSDYSSHTLNFIIITECIPFGVAPIEPAYKKGYDYKVPEIREHYRVLAKSLARLIAAHKTGVLGHDVEECFPFARSARNFDPVEDPEAKVDRLIDFISRVAPQLFVAEARDPAFLARWREDLLFGFRHKDAVVSYLHSNVDYTGLCHPNLNVDNAWFWRDEAGELQVGLLDWGGAGQMSIGQALSGMLMMLEPEMHLEIADDVLTTFIREYAEQGGTLLDRHELKLHYKASVFSTALHTIVLLIMDAMMLFSEDDYRSMENRFDTRLHETQICSCINWIDDMLREWLDDLTPGDACRQIVARNG